ncbi:unnamed protein product [Orchesella dallaii]|uniref:NtA domain-containing protein n=1 Tax=Orchesella dallaii TaxID=48710 RepID=A0ABP1SA77_9HEXA
MKGKEILPVLIINIVVFFPATSSSSLLLAEEKVLTANKVSSKLNGIPQGNFSHMSHIISYDNKSKANKNSLPSSSEDDDDNKGRWSDNRNGNDSDKHQPLSSHKHQQHLPFSSSSPRISSQGDQDHDDHNNVRSSSSQSSSYLKSANSLVNKKRHKRSCLINSVTALEAAYAVASSSSKDKTQKMVLTGLVEDVMVLHNQHEHRRRSRGASDDHDDDTEAHTRNRIANNDDDDDDTILSMADSDNDGYELYHRGYSILHPATRTRMGFTPAAAVTITNSNTNRIASTSGGGGDPKSYNNNNSSSSSLFPLEMYHKNILSSLATEPAYSYPANNNSKNRREKRQKSMEVEEHQQNHQLASSWGKGSLALDENNNGSEMTNSPNKSAVIVEDSNSNGNGHHFKERNNNGERIHFQKEFLHENIFPQYQLKSVAKMPLSSSSSSGDFFDEAIPRYAVLVRVKRVIRGDRTLENTGIIIDGFGAHHDHHEDGRNLRFCGRGPRVSVRDTRIFILDVDPDKRITLAAHPLPVTLKNLRRIDESPQEMRKPKDKPDGYYGSVTLAYHIVSSSSSLSLRQPHQEQKRT